MLANFSHVTKSRIFKNSNLRRKDLRSFRGNLLQNHFRNLNNIQISQVDWAEVILVWAPFERQKVEVYIFDRTNFSGFAGSSPPKRIQIPENRYFFLISGSGSARNQKFGLFFAGKCLYKKTLQCKS